MGAPPTRKRGSSGLFGLDPNAIGDGLAPSLGRSIRERNKPTGSSGSSSPLTILTGTATGEITTGVSKALEGAYGLWSVHAQFRAIGVGIVSGLVADADAGEVNYYSARRTGDLFEFEVHAETLGSRPGASLSSDAPYDLTLWVVARLIQTL